MLDEVGTGNKENSFAKLIQHFAHQEFLYIYYTTIIITVIRYALATSRMNISFTVIHTSYVTV